MRGAWASLGAALLAGAATAQTDLRDVVTTRDGREIHGRVVQRFEPDEVLVVQGGKRVRVAKADVVTMRTVTDELRDFFAHRARTAGNVARDWLLVEWADSHRLPAMARLQALHVVLLEPTHAAAQRYLGHRQRGGADGEWLWRRKSSWFSYSAYERETRSFGTPKELDGEHFRVRSNAALRRTVDALFDLERCYVFWVDELGEKLRPREVLELMDVHLHRSAADFPALTVLGFPYYLPKPNGDVAYTYFADEEPRPELLFQLATEQLLYNALADGVALAVASPRDRLVAWVDIGLGQWAERHMQGSAGYAEPAAAGPDRAHASALVEGRPYALPNLLGVRYGRFQDPTRDTVKHWAMASSFVAFLLDREVNEERPDRFLEFVRLAYAGGKGGSSSVLDRVLGTELEKLEPAFERWLLRAAAR